MAKDEIEETETEEVEETEEETDGESPWDKLSALIDERVGHHVGELRKEMESWRPKTSSRPSSKGSPSQKQKKPGGLEAFFNSLGGSKRE